MAETRLRYHDGIERPAPKANETVGGLIASMTRESETRAERCGRSVGASHAEGATHPAIVRFAQAPRELPRDSLTTHRGVAIEVLDVAGAALRGHGATTQDFVLATGPAFRKPDARSFLGSMKHLEIGTTAGAGLMRATE
ncbi:hypothetical protein [Methylobacterium sp. NEAU K]|uniref:hypothetical protein n=1 Tax=Methylobacterium sp. NEAU K TaxID=3064946 RepID=UPI0027358413|nr:hypothetical protein [Methylobacterium sp. NEAU K]MDP4002995.1 hypothetical protein [Methylobacterium sp. NEAU K]